MLYLSENVFATVQN